MGFSPQFGVIRLLTGELGSIWGGGFLYQLGVLDYSGGYVIHLSSGTAGEYISRSKEVPRLTDQDSPLHTGSALVYSETGTHSILTTSSSC